MWSRRDQIQAYQFLRRRLTAAMNEADPNGLERPARRLMVAVGAGTALAVLALAVFGVLGIVRRSAPSNWATSGKIVVEKETGAKFVVDPQGVLHQVQNSTSAMLYYNKRADVVIVASKELNKRPRGTPVGIANAPDSLPPAGKLFPGPWTVCSTVALNETGNPNPSLAVLAGWPVPDAPLGANTAVVVRDGQKGAVFVITEGRRHRVPDAATLPLLGLPSKAVPVRGAWLDLVPQAADLAPIDVPQAGSEGLRLNGRETTIGQMFALSGAAGDSQLFVQLVDGLSPVKGDLPARLLFAGEGGRTGNPDGEPTPLSPRTFGDAPRAPDFDTGDLPPEVPSAAAPRGKRAALCATLREPSPAVEIRVLPDRPGPPGMATGPRAPGAETADTVYVPPGRGALVQAVVPGQSRLPALFLLTDLGILYPVVTPSVAGVLGYDKVQPVQVPRPVLRLLPSGPSLYTGAVQEPAVNI